MVSVVAYAAFDLASTSKAGVALGNEDAIAGVSIGEIQGGVNMLLVGVDKRPAMARSETQKKIPASSMTSPCCCTFRRTTRRPLW